jgi:hypothetical protein
MGYSHPNDLVFGENDELTDKVNEIREELTDLLGGEWGEQQGHIALQMGNYEHYLPMSTTARTMMQIDGVVPFGEQYVAGYNFTEGK